jgi:hypothetical protein
MNNPFKKKPVQTTSLQNVIDQITFEMRGFPAESPEFSRCADQLKKLYKLQAIDKPDRVSSDTKALIAANLAGILVIINHERAHVITSKALTYLPRLIR